MVERFKTADEIKECAKYYIDLLGLQDWRIVFKLSDDIDSELAGCNEHDYTCKIAKITIREHMPKDLWVKQPHEEVLIHELLHCKFIDVSNNTLEGAYYEQHMHTLLGDITRAIVKARYNFTDNYYGG